MLLVTIFFLLTSAFLYYSNSTLKLDLELKTDEINDLHEVKRQKMAAIDALQAEVGKILPGGKELTILVHKGADDMSSSNITSTGA